ncbi:hypothetical protein [Streptosporangium sp. NPDC000509]|uniref:hypothetical protein n=1 Tax=Streptosporangium sp. NPDC000509 TaxID=3366186 RepID=UPI0036C390C9
MTALWPASKLTKCRDDIRQSARWEHIVRLDFVGVDPGNPDDDCPAVFVDPETGDFYFQGDTVTDKDILAWINSDSRIKDSESVVRLPAVMAAIIMEAARGSYERGKRRFAPDTHPRPAEDVRTRLEEADLR